MYRAEVGVWLIRVRRAETRESIKGSSSALRRADRDGVWGIVGGLGRGYCPCRQVRVMMQV